MVHQRAHLRTKPGLGLFTSVNIGNLVPLENSGGKCGTSRCRVTDKRPTKEGRPIFHLL